jgi:ABC-2 type transport system ATP-binding protein
MRPVIQVSGPQDLRLNDSGVDRMSFEVNDGEIFGLIGPNGAGKTTTMECIEGLHTPDRGTILVLGLDPFNDGLQAAIPDWSPTPAGAVAEANQSVGAVDLWASLYQKTAIDCEQLREQLGLADMRNAWFITLSGGQKQRLFMALALINDPEAVFLNELHTRD